MCAKVLGTLLFPAVFILMLVLPVFEMIPQDQYLNVFNNQGVANGSYESTQYTMYTMMQNDYHTGGVMIGFIVVAVLCVLCGIFLLWANRPKIAAAPASIILAEVVFPYVSIYYDKWVRITVDRAYTTKTHRSTRTEVT